MYQQKDIHTVLLAGAGVMGSSFAQIFARHSYDVILYDIADASLEKARKLIHVNVETQVNEGSLCEKTAREMLDRITMTTSKEYFPTIDFALEAIVENMEIKQCLFRELSEATKPDAILCHQHSPGNGQSRNCQGGKGSQPFLRYALGQSPPSDSLGGGHCRRA